MKLEYCLCAEPTVIGCTRACESCDARLCDVCGPMHDRKHEREARRHSDHEGRTRMTTITHEQIRALHDEAGQAGDLLQAAICQIALHGEPDPRTYAALSPDERDTLRQEYGERNRWSMMPAIAECEYVIADAAARAD